MLDIPERLPLAVQVALSLHKALERGLWQNVLPSERRLCEIYRVSRPVIRDALGRVARDGVLDIRQGRNIRILARPRPSAAPASRRVLVVLDEPASDMQLTFFQSIAELRAQLAGRGIASEIFRCQSHGTRVQQRKLEDHLSRHPVHCCILISVRMALQQWFSAQPFPSLVLGSCHTPVLLPSFDVDYRSVCRHAAGVLYRAGHRRIAFVVPDSGVAGDLASEQGFLEAGSAPRAVAGVRAMVLRHDPVTRNLPTRLDQLFASPTPPTALLVARPHHVMGVILHLLRRGLTVPGRVSLIARDHDNLFAHIATPVAHYAFEGDTYNHRLVRLVLHLVRDQHLPARPNLIFPRFYSGSTVARPEAS
ncbi:MAG: substrate-binding domain-containing protein [Opitutaceae bacterium]|nr:substrate-binding domain-containing protein [Opitutaceae bacterium]